MRHLRPPPPCWVVLAWPPVAVSTTWAYGRLRIPLTHDHGDASMLAEAVERGDWGAVAPLLHSDFEDVVLSEVSGVAELRRAFDASGALGALLSGSGSTVFGLAPYRDRAEAVARRMGGTGAQVRVARTLERGVEVVPLA